MIEELRVGVLLRFEGLIGAVARAARARQSGPFALYILDLADATALRFALALHPAPPAEPGATQPAAERRHVRGPCLAGAAAVARVARVAAQIAGEAIGAQVLAVQQTGAVPVVVVAQGLALVVVLDAPIGDVAR